MLVLSMPPPIDKLVTDAERENIHLIILIVDI
jgi:hypothetical protein